MQIYKTTDQSLTVISIPLYAVEIGLPVVATDSV